MKTMLNAIKERIWCIHEDYGNTINSMQTLEIFKLDLNHFLRELFVKGFGNVRLHAVKCCDVILVKLNKE